MHTFWRDIRYGIHMLVKSPGFTVVAVLTLALGIGANSAIFSIVNSLLLNPLPYRNSDRLAIIWSHSPGANVEKDWPSPGQFEAIKANSTVYEDIAIVHGRSLNVGGLSNPTRAGAVEASSNLLPLLGAKPLIGRLFLAEEDTPGKTKTVVLSNAFWRREFGGNQNILQSTLLLNGEKYDIVGVLPPEFTLGYEVVPTVASVPEPDLFLPLPMNTEQKQEQGDENYNLVARLKPGASIAQAQSELDIATKRLAEQFPDRYPVTRRFSFSIKPLLEQVVGDVRRPLIVLLAAVGCVLLIACANVANLMLTRATAREREIAIRSALGAARLRVIRQLLTESVLLSLVGGVIGLVIAYWMLDALRWLSPSNIPRLPAIRMDARVLAFTSVIAVFTGILFGVAPALRTSKMNLSEALKEGARNVAGGRHERLRKLLVISELALSLVLLISAGLLIRSFISVEGVYPGFDPQNVIGMRLSVAGTSFQGDRREIFYRDLLERVRHLPGVKSAGIADNLPLSGGIGWGTISIDGYQASAGQEAIQADVRVAGVGYFETMAVPLIKGRLFDDHDTKDSSAVIVIDENMARNYWPNANPLGGRIKFGRDDKNPWMTIVGVVGSVKQYDLENESRVTFYLPASQGLGSTMYLVARTSIAPSSVGATIASQVRSMDPNVPIFDVKSMDQRLSESLARRRFAMVALGVFAGFAFLLAVIGIYGVISYSVAQRTSELGIRLALGARQVDVLRLVLSAGVKLALIGIGVGLVLSFAVTRFLSGLLFGVRATDLLTFSALSVLLIVVSLLACYLPARRATKVDPLVALRYE
ncbi:MAG TPA: ABC transporter permease [Pyrinomonadaceae bacterium]|nr:ABC transporter permease [Pyrinomonadaceae bacterium]